jgi:hypothetical protein
MPLHEAKAIFLLAASYGVIFIFQVRRRNLGASLAETSWIRLPL